MPDLGLPQVKLTFAAAIERTIAGGEDGRLALVVRDAVQVAGAKLYELTSPAGLTEQGVTAAAATTAAISMAFRGGIRTLVLVLLAPLGDLADAYALLRLARFDVCAVGSIAAGEVAAYVTWAKGLYDTNAKHALFLVANATAPDHPAIINFSAVGIMATDPDAPAAAAASYTAAAFLPRIAGAVAGVRLWEGVTFLRIPEIVSVTALSKTDIDAAIAAGKLVLYFNGATVKIARGVTSLTTIAPPYAAEFKKIKIVRTLNRIEDDITRNIEENWLGKVPNTAAQKQLLVSVIEDYLQELEVLTVLQARSSRIAVDIVKQRAYLKTILPLAEVDAMTAAQVLEAATGDKLYLVGTVRPVDAIEDVEIVINL